MGVQKRLEPPRIDPEQSLSLIRFDTRQNLNELLDFLNSKT
jgi:hypothetical protein